ncbi:hypothetical protein GGR53DRAFT_522837 [Hypoxylon sp. FL1150]|nr:hypothetical protein GGR53DRAFT_522837 [Hypoxylon sp. FL1150]
MPSVYSSILSFASVLSVVHGHAALIAVQGIEGSPQGIGFKVEANLPRNCTSISPCQQDTTIIRDAEIAANVVNECGRTELSGNIDIGENTENALAAGVVTQVQSGTQVKVTLHQVNADGAGPYACDLVEAGNNGVISQNLTVENNVPGVNGFSQAKTQDFQILVNMPSNFTCSGSSAGNVCTVRCRNNALAGPFGGCFPVQQVDVQPSQNTAAGVTTNLSLDKVLAQVAQDNKDLPGAIAAIQNAGTDEALQNVAAVSALLDQGKTFTSIAASTQVLDIQTGAAATATAATDATTTSASAAATATSSGKKNKGNGNNNNANAANNGNNRGNNNNKRRATVFYA